MKKILFAASEAVPFIKTGGLADVVGSLPKCFDKRYFDVRVIIPKYLCIKQEWRDKMQYVDHFYMDYLGQSRYVGILQYVHEGITFYFIDNESYFNGPKPYGDWYWDLEKFCFFCRAALSALPVIGFQPDAGDYEKDLENYINAMRKGEDIWHAQNFDREYDSMVKKLATKRMKQYRDDVEKQIKAWEG